MFIRLVLEDWTLAMPIIAFFFTFSIFVATTWWAMRLPKERRERIAALPLYDTDSEVR